MARPVYVSIYLNTPPRTGYSRILVWMGELRDSEIYDLDFLVKHVLKGFTGKFYESGPIVPEATDRLNAQLEAQQPRKA